MAKKIEKQTGFTLIELLLVMALITTFFAIAPPVLKKITQFYRLNQAKNDIQRDARSVFGLMSRNLRQADPTTVTIDSLSTQQPPYSRISFSKANGDSVSYYQEGKLLKMAAAGTVNTLCENVRFLSFSSPRTDDDNLISLTLTLEKQTYNEQTKALQLSVQKIRLPNE